MTRSSGSAMDPRQVVPPENPQPTRAREGGAFGAVLREDPTLTSERPSLRMRQQRSQGLPESRFVRVRVLGIGGMGEIVEYEDTVLGRHVAVKRVRDDMSERSDAEWTLEREAQVTGMLEHPNIVPVYDAGRHPELGPYYVMRLLVQPTLADILQKLADGDRETITAFPLNRLLRCFLQVCQAIEYAHCRGVIHCDLKPSNVLVGAFGDVLVVDWGFAHTMHDGVSFRGGTPGYMAPDQLAPHAHAIDARSDVFALGAMLFEILTLERALPSIPMPEMIEKVAKGKNPYPDVKRPSIVTSRPVAAELDEACVRALAFAPADRYPRVAELAAAIESFLEGTAEHERRLARADSLTAEGDALAHRYREIVRGRHDRVRAIEELRGRIAPWADGEQKRPLWRLEDEQTQLESLAVRTFHSATTAYEHALEEIPGHAPARHGLAVLCWSELRRAEERRDEFDRTYFEALCREHDDGTLGIDGTRGSLSIAVTGAEATIVLETVAEIDRRPSTTHERSLGAAPIARHAVAPGNYALRIARDGRAAVRAPVVVRAGEYASVVLGLEGADRTDAGEVFVPGGIALLGGHETSSLGRELTEVYVGPFVIAEFPVTFAEYLAFVAALEATEPRLAKKRLPRTIEGSPYWEWDGRWFVPAAVTAWGEDPRTLGAFPVFGVSAESAAAFASWKSARTGRHFRLPTDVEWEKAARGVDGRAYPWGDRFDASFCKMRLSRPGPCAPEPCGAFDADCSPYGARDLAGGIAEWVFARESDDVATSGGVASRGGAWCDWPSECHAGGRRPYEPNERSQRIGLRLVHGR